MLTRIRSVVVMGLVAVALAATGPVGWAQSADQQKADEERAKAIAADGEKLLKAKQYVEARAKYVEALQLGENGKYNQKVAEIDGAIDKEIRKELDAAEKHFEAGNYDQALARLDATLPLRKEDPTVLFNRALIAHKQGKKQDAVKHLDSALGGVSNEKERIRLLQLKTQWETGESLQTVAPAQQEQLKDLNAELASNESSAETCGTLRAVAGSFTNSPSVVFNLAKCAEDEGNLEEASRLLDQYLALAPEAVDGAETKTDVQEVRELEKRAGPEVVTLYSEADRAARKGQYKRAIDALTRAADKAPQLAETQVKLARLHQGAGNIEAARTHYQKYLTLETRPAMVAPVRDEIAALEKRAAEYQALVDPARERLLTWMHRYIVDGRPMGSAASSDELKSIAEQLQKASVMMPLGTELNRMLGTIYLIDGNYGPARKAFGAVAEAGEPIWFYATANGVNGWEKNILAKVEVHGRKVRVLGVTRIDKKGFVALTDGSTPSARLAGFLTPAQLPAAGSKTPFLEIASVSNAETDDDTVRLMWSDDPAATTKREVRLTPFRFTNMAPASGPPSRRFANPYTKLFRDFADVQVKLGAERMTGGEKFGFAMQMAAAAYAGGAMALAGGAHSTANIVAAAMRSATWATIELQNAMDRQARMFQETQFKIMPLEDPKPVFRKDALR